MKVDIKIVGFLVIAAAVLFIVSIVASKAGISCVHKYGKIWQCEVNND